LFLLTSETESFGLAGLVALAAGVPVISSNTGGIPEVNQHGYSGFLSEVGDVDDMANNAIALLSDAALLQQFRQQALEVAMRFEMQAILPRYEALYEEVIHKASQLY